ncbi:hypothetical protein ACO2Q8_13090 [Larkinella sp. VNQ87]|uniref:hypothetical protein n=1 Tax=Larkinella sp. VNQ87 TaxID=3400921 RepID=UPI003C05CF90
MAATEDEWERLFRQRLENYESEPEEDALERILSDFKPPPKPIRNRTRRVAASLAVLSVLGLFLIGVWQSREEQSETKPALATRSKPAHNRQNTSPVGTDDLQKTVSLNELNRHAEENRLAPKPAELLAVRENKLVKPANETQNLDTKRLSTVIDKQNAGSSGRSNRVRNTGENERYAIENATNASSNVLTNGQDITFSAAELRFETIRNRATRLLWPVSSLPAPSFETYYQTAAIEPERVVRRPSWVGSVMPLYTFRQLTPARQDEIVMEEIRPATSLSARTGWRMQVGAEWPVSQRFGIRVGVAYQQVQQQMTYKARALRSDSTKIEWVDGQTVKLTPLYKSEERQVNNTWRYVALSAEGRWQLNRRQTAMRHYLTAGGSLGYLVQGQSAQRWQPFLQASYGIERRLTNQLSLQVEPGLVYNLMAMSDHSRDFSVRPYSYGLVVGLRWNPDI